VLAASGHVAGIINPAARQRRNYWLNPRREEDPDRWFARAASHAGSWWPHWSAWLARFGGGRIAARAETGAEIEPAPGRYVKEKAG
jgi:polyhydroxyalkanoate synthase subunit PhaC